MLGISLPISGDATCSKRGARSGGVTSRSDGVPTTDRVTAIPGIQALDKAGRNARTYPEGNEFRLPRARLRPFCSMASPVLTT